MPPSRRSVRAATGTSGKRRQLEVPVACVADDGREQLRVAHGQDQRTVPARRLAAYGRALHAPRWVQKRASTGGDHFLDQVGFVRARGG